MAKMKIDADRRAEIARERRAKTRANLLAAAFDLFGEENGLYSRIEDIAGKAGISRQTLYNHFSGMDELRDALTYEVTHDFLTAVTDIVNALEDPREHASVAIRFYLERARRDRRWAWSMINLSASGIIFGAETYNRAELTIKQGMAVDKLSIKYSALGRDMVLGTALAALSTILRADPGPDYPNMVAEHVLLGMGVPQQDATEIANRALPNLPPNFKLDEM
jgi:AcrR family transcriptional regulator